MKDIRIEYPARGTTYCKQVYGVYSYDRWPRSSVLAGQQRRTWLGEYPTQEEAQLAHPEAKPNCGCGFQAPSLSHLPDDGDY
jgi:hypothetical protein